MTQYLLSIDPGKSTGVTLWEYGETKPATRIGAWQFGGGAAGLRDWVDEHYDPPWYSDEWGEMDGQWRWGRSMISNADPTPKDRVSIVSEKFTPLQGKGFSLTMDAVEPLVCEGVLIGRHLLPAYVKDFAQEGYQRPGEMYWCGGSSKAEKLKASRAWLKSKGLLLTGKDVGQKDADDAISSTLHALTWFRKRGHRSSLEHYWGEKPESPQPE